MVGKEVLSPETKDHDNMPLGQEDCRTIYRELKSRGLEIPYKVEQAVEDDPEAATDYLDSMRYFLDPDNYRQIQADWKKRATYVAISHRQVIGHGRTLKGLIRRCRSAKNDLTFVGTFRRLSRTPIRSPQPR